jgi:hypothetical protein
MVRLFREALAGERDVDDAARLCLILSRIARVIEREKPREGAAEA